MRDRVVLVAKALPATTLVVLAVLSLLPWGIAEGERFALPMLPLAAVYFWSRDHASLVPAALVFGVGLAVDVLTFGPLGYWPIVYLGTLAGAAIVDRMAGRLAGLAEWIAWAAVAALVSVLAWGLASAYFASLADARPIVVAWIGLVLVWPITVALLAPLARLVVGRPAINLERGG